MKITREEFKELVVLFKEVDNYANGCSKYVSTELLEKLAYPFMEWIVYKLGIDYECGGDLISEFNNDGEAPISWDCDENGHSTNVVYSSDLDEIYDTYFDNEN